MFQDKTLKCRECGADFVFSASEQEFYAERGFQNEPGRCPVCRQARKQQRGDRQMFTAVCASCGNSCTVPFQPTGEKPVYCRDCFAVNRSR